MKLKATKVLQAVIQHGYVPAALFCVGPLDEGAVVQGGLMLKKQTASSHRRTLGCSFEPIPEGVADPARSQLSEFIRQVGGKATNVAAIKLGALEGMHAQIMTRGPEGVGVAVNAITLLLDGMVHRYTLSSLEAKASEAKDALVAFVTDACAP